MVVATAALWGSALPGQFLPVQEHHEIREYRIGIDTAGADLAHQIHAHRVTAQRKESAVAKAQDAAKAPDQIDAQRQQCIAEIFEECPP